MGFVSRGFSKFVKIAQNPSVRPVEVWALRAVLAWVGVKLGIDVAGLVK